MPRDQLKSLADKHNLSMSTVERYWRECKKSVDNAEDNYDRVMGCVKNRCQKKSDSNAKEAYRKKKKEQSS